MVLEEKKSFCCSIVYHSLGPALLKTFALQVRNKIGKKPDVFKLAKDYYNSVYNSEVLNSFQLAYANYFIEQTDEAKDAFNKARTHLLFLLDATAEYVDSIANGDARIIKLAGFEPITIERNRKKAVRIRKKMRI